MKYVPLTLRVVDFEVGKVPGVVLTYDAPNMDVVSEIVDHHVRTGHNVGAKMIAPYTLEVRLT